MLYVSVVTIGLLILPLIMNIVEHFKLLNMKRFPAEKLAEFVLVLLLAAGSLALILFHHYAKLQSSEDIPFVKLSAM